MKFVLENGYFSRMETFRQPEITLFERFNATFAFSCQSTVVLIKRNIEYDSSERGGTTTVKRIEAKLPQPKLICTLGHKLHCTRCVSIQEATKGCEASKKKTCQEQKAGLHF